MQAVLADGARQRADDVFLPQHLARCLRPVPPVQRLVLLLLRHVAPHTREVTVHPSSTTDDSDASWTGSSGQAPLRHPPAPAYGCFLPDLTGFAGWRRAGPEPSTLRAESCPGPSGPRTGIQPRRSGFRVQGTAGSPPSTVTRASIRPAPDTPRGADPSPVLRIQTSHSRDLTEPEPLVDRPGLRVIRVEPREIGGERARGDHRQRRGDPATPGGRHDRDAEDPDRALVQVRGCDADGLVAVPRDERRERPPRRRTPRRRTARRSPARSRTPTCSTCAIAAAPRSSVDRLHADAVGEHGLRQVGHVDRHARPREQQR